jgi:hypothetical protein
MSPVLTRVVEIHMHLSCIRMSELIKLQVDDNQTAKTAMEKEQVDAKPLISNAKSLLSPDESKVSAKLKQECFKVLNEGCFQFGFRILVL